MFHPNRGGCLRGKYFDDWGAPQGGRGTYNGVNHQCRHLLKGEEKTRFFVKRNPSRDDTKKTLKTVSEGEIRVNTDEYSIIDDCSGIGG
ncbi:MAG: hypothetical protein J7I99_05625 [Methanophagales archaeon]|nr:hypothetical protein [Methanophagales archaeon]